MSDGEIYLDETLQRLYDGDLGVLDQLASMTAGSFEASGLDSETFMLVRMAALASIDAAPASWFANLAAGAGADIPRERIIGTLIAIAPVIGTARIVSAAGGILKALGMAKLAVERREGSLANGGGRSCSRHSYGEMESSLDQVCQMYIVICIYWTWSI